MANRKKTKENSAVVMASKEEYKLVGANAGDPPDPPNPPSTHDSMNALIDAKVSILNADFVGSFHFKKDNGFSLIIAPCSKPMDQKGISLNELLTQGSDHELDTTALKDLVKPDKLGSVSFKFDMAFLYVNKVNNLPTEIEYAFQVSVVNGEKSLIPDDVRNFFDVKEVKLAIWNTKRKGVLSKMDLKTPEQILDDLTNQ